MNEMGKFYKPIIKDNIQIDGFDAQLIPDGETGLIIQKLFITSLEENFNIYADKILSIFNIQNPGSHINDTLIIIKSDNNAYFYNRFPFSIECITKRDMINNHAVFKRDLIDITSISFKDSFTDLNPLDGDQFIWIFRVNWIFGLYFDLSKTLKQDNLLIELGFHYKRLSYISVYDFIENESYFKTMINDGWFPFISLINDGLEKIQQFYIENKKSDFYITQLIDSFDENRISEMSARWWRNSIFNGKRRIIEAGIKSYLLNTVDGYINCVKNLVSELEGIIRLSYYNEFKKDPTMRELKDFISNKGQSKFKNVKSLFFPEKFLNYLDDFIFKNFDIENLSFPESRHTVAHGVGPDNIYNKEFSLKLILTLDNIYYFLC